jgi:mannosyl-oligosaccharide alpha-1,2-mannosidase
MGMVDEFDEAVDSIVKIDFTATTQKKINVFETTIRYLGGFLSAYDLSGDRRLLDKSLELADMLYAAFDTPNRMPILRWDFHAAREGQPQSASDHVVLAEMGSLCLEFTHLSQITHDPKWYDAVARVMNVFQHQQYESNIPGMWPLIVNGRDMEFYSKQASQVFSIAALGDSVYEYLPKMYALLGGSEQYASMYNGAMNTLVQHSLFRPMAKQADRNVLIPGALRFLEERINVQHEIQHLSCFAGGMFALGGKLLQNEGHVEIGRKLMDGCVWAYETFPTKIMPETASVVACIDKSSCQWDEEVWRNAVLHFASVEEKEAEKNSSEIIKTQRLPPSFSRITDRGYRLRPEAIESVFILYRTTGDENLQETAWNMFRSVYTHTRTKFAHAAIKDVTNSTAPKEDSMESFW